jgi:hypothetical protein
MDFTLELLKPIPKFFFRFCSTLLKLITSIIHYIYHMDIDK